MAPRRNPSAIPEIDCGTRDLPEIIDQSDKPFVVRGIAGLWPATKLGPEPNAVIDYLNEFAIDRPVSALETSSNPSGRIGYSDDFSGFNFKSDRKSLRALLAELRNRLNSTSPSDGLYIGSTNVDHWLPGFREINGFPLLDAKDPLVSLWLGTRSFVSAHFDFPNNFAAVILGERQFTLFPPEMIRNLYVGPIERTPAGQPISLADSDIPDDKRFPNFQIAMRSAQQATLAPGDAIFIPSLWWHEIKSKSPLNGLINYWWRSNPAHFGSPLTALQHLVFSLRSLPEKERLKWRPLIEHYIFGSDEELFAHIPPEARGILNQPDNEEAAYFKQFLANQLLPRSHSS